MGRRFIGLWLVSLGALVGCEARLTLGTSCAYTSECETPLTCRLGRCREECRTYRDCPLGSVCLPDPASGLGACRLPDETTCTASCPVGTSCVGGTCAVACSSDVTCLGTVCDLTSAYCIEPVTTDAGAPLDGGVPLDTAVPSDVPGADAPLDCASCGSGLCVSEVCDPVVAIAGGAFFSCLRRASGAVDCAGSDASGSLGDGATSWPGDLRPTYAPVAGGLVATALSVGWEHACVIAGGAVWCWGRGDFGQIGAMAASEAPVRVLAADTADPYVAIAAGGYHTCVLHDSGVIDCFGRNDLGQLGDGTAHGPCQSELDCTTTPVRVVSITDATAIDAYRFDTCAIREDGTLYCWGGDEAGVLGGATTSTTCTRADDGAAIDCSRSPLLVPGLTNVTDVSIAGEHGCAIADGELACWGQSDHGRLGVPPDSSVHGAAPVTLPAAPADVEVGGYHTTVRLVDGRVFSFGLNDDARLGVPAGSPAASATPLEVPGLGDVETIASGSFHTCALDDTHVVSCWGLDEQGQLGDGAAGVGSTPTAIVRD